MSSDKKKLSKTEKDRKKWKKKITQMKVTSVKIRFIFFEAF